MEGILGGEMPFSLKNALMLPKHSEVGGKRIRQFLNESQLTGAIKETAGEVMKNESKAERGHYSQINCGNTLRRKLK